jgi:hypothetical protein
MSPQPGARRSKSSVRIQRVVRSPTGPSTAFRTLQNSTGRPLRLRSSLDRRLLLKFPPEESGPYPFSVPQLLDTKRRGILEAASFLRAHVWFALIPTTTDALVQWVAGGALHSRLRRRSACHGVQSVALLLINAAR